MKNDRRRFKRVISCTGKELWNLSSFCKANLDADKTAFAALCSHLKAKDRDRTLIGFQVQNEPGILGSDRDYGAEAQAIFDKPVPSKFVNAMKKAGKGQIYDIWQGAGGKNSGNWAEMFGWEGGEFMTAWSLAGYIDSVAAWGRRSMIFRCTLTSGKADRAGGRFPVNPTRPAALLSKCWISTSGSHRMWI